MDSRASGRRILALVADGRFHSGQALAERLGISRSAVWKHLRALQHELGLEMDAVKGKGYRLRDPLDLLDGDRILRDLDAAAAANLARLVVHDSIDSTNSWLMREAALGAEAGTVCLAERQTHGRGRHSRGWVSPFGTNVYLSLLWRYDLAPAQLTGLSLACGVAVARGLSRMGVSGLALKWPNDVLWNRRKLAGLLLEVRGESAGPSHVVAGLGLNTHMPRSEATRIDQPWADLASIPQAQSASRNRLVAQLLSELMRTMEQYPRGGLEPLVDEWARFDHFRGERVVLRVGPREVRGDYLGIDRDGSLRLRVGGETVSYNVGEVNFCGTCA